MTVQTWIPSSTIATVCPSSTEYTLYNDFEILQILFPASPSDLLIRHPRWINSSPTWPSRLVQMDKRNTTRFSKGCTAKMLVLLPGLGSGTKWASGASHPMKTKTSPSVSLVGMSSIFGQCLILSYIFSWPHHRHLCDNHGTFYIHQLRLVHWQRLKRIAHRPHDRGFTSRFDCQRLTSLPKSQPGWRIQADDSRVRPVF